MTSRCCCLILIVIATSLPVTAAMAAHRSSSSNPTFDDGGSLFADLALTPADQPVDEFEEPTIYDSGFDVVADTPIYVNTVDKRQLTTNWAVCTGMARVVHEYFVGKRRLPLETSNLRSLSRSNDGDDRCSTSPRPCRLWDEIVSAQGRDVLSNIGRLLSFSSRHGAQKYSKLKAALGQGRTAMVHVKCTQRGALLHSLVAYRIDDYEDKAVIWVYDCNLIYFPSSMDPTWQQAEQRSLLLPPGQEGATTTELQRYLKSPAGRQWSKDVLSDPSATQLVFDKRSQRFSFSRAYGDLYEGQLVNAYVASATDGSNLSIAVTE